MKLTNCPSHVAENQQSLGVNPGSLFQRTGLNTMLLGNEQVCIESLAHGELSCDFNLDPRDCATCLGLNPGSIT